jgi:hypothetical protein
MGYDIHTKVYRLFNPRIKKVILGQDVKFNEMHIALDSESNVSSLEQNTTKKEMGPKCFFFPKECHIK